MWSGSSFDWDRQNPYYGDSRDRLPGVQDPRDGQGGGGGVYRERDQPGQRTTPKGPQAPDSEPTWTAPPANPNASPQGGPASVGGSGGYGFVNLGQYLYANPQGSYSQIPGGPTNPQNLQYGTQAHAFNPSGSYTSGMAGVDGGINQAYGLGTPYAGADLPGGGTGRNDGPTYSADSQGNQREDQRYKNISSLMNGRY